MNELFEMDQSEFVLLVDGHWRKRALVTRREYARRFALTIYAIAILPMLLDILIAATSSDNHNKMAALRRRKYVRKDHTSSRIVVLSYRGWTKNEYSKEPVSYNCRE